MIKILGIIFIAVGLLFVIKTESFLRNFGRIGFFEQHLGTEGGSRLGYKLMGLFIIFLGMLMVTGGIGRFLSFVLAPLIRVYQ